MEVILDVLTHLNGSFYYWTPENFDPQLCNSVY